MKKGFVAKQERGQPCPPGVASLARQDKADKAVRAPELEPPLVKPHGFVMDFVGIFDKLEKALAFDSDEINAIVDGAWFIVASNRRQMFDWVYGTGKRFGDVGSCRGRGYGARLRAPARIENKV